MKSRIEDCPTIVHLERWRNGDDAAFDPLHRRLLPLLRVRVLRHRAWPLLQGHFEADDVLQEFWVRSIHTVKHRFEHAGRGSLLGFLGKIVDRQVIDLARRHRAQKRGLGEVQRLSTQVEVAGGNGVARNAPATPTANARCSELEELARQELAPREFEAWRLVEMQGFTSEEAGVAMRASDASVRGLLLRGRARLITRLRSGRSG